MAKQLSNLASPTLFIFNSARDTIAGSQKQRARCVCVMPVHFQVLSAFDMYVMAKFYTRGDCALEFY